MKATFESGDGYIRWFIDVTPSEIQSLEFYPLTPDTRKVTDLLRVMLCIAEQLERREFGLTRMEPLYMNRRNDGQRVAVIPNRLDPVANEYGDLLGPVAFRVTDPLVQSLNLNSESAAPETSSVKAIVLYSKRVISHDEVV